MSQADFRNFSILLGGRWSTSFQWLPSEVKFADQTGLDVRIASYINNLHPVHHRTVYPVIEKLISRCIPLWNEVLVKGTKDDASGGRLPPRIRTYGHEADPPGLPEWADGMIRDPYNFTREQWLPLVRDYLSQSDNPNYKERDVHPDEVEQHTKFVDGTWEEDENPYTALEALEWKYERIKKILHPEPGAAFTYEQWRAGDTAGSVVASGRVYWEPKPHPDQHEYDSINLEEDFRSRGLQIIVKVAGTELTPEKPDFDGGSWHLEGMLNEHIVATAIYCHDVSNVTESRLRFRQEATLGGGDEMNYKQDEEGPLCEIFGTESMLDQEAIQELGTLTTPHGRLLAFPNTLQHKVEPFSLVDRTKPGHRRFIVLWPVDPHYRVAPTANVPPQHHEWWEPHALRRVLLRSGLPQEVRDSIRSKVGEWPMGLDEAKELRLELMQERTKLMPMIESNYDYYNLCEH